MGAAVAVDEQINRYLGQLNSKQKRAVLTVVKALAEDQREQQNTYIIPEAHKKLVRERIKKYSKSPEQLLDWNKVQKSIKLENRNESIREIYK